MKTRKTLSRVLKDIAFTLFLFSPFFLPAIIEAILEGMGV